MTRHERLYRHLLGLYPASFRERFEDEMVTLFVDQLRDARSSRGGAGTAWLWVRSVADLVSTAPRQHLTKEALVPRPVDPASVSLADPLPVNRLGPTGYAIALVPLWVGILLGVFASGYMEPVFANPPEVLGLPFGIFLVFVAGLLMAFGLLAMRATRSPILRAAAFLLLTVPSLILIVLSPALILILLNLNV